MAVKMYPHIVTKESEDQIRDNIIINTFDIAILGSYTFYNIQDGVVDVYNDLSGVDLDASSQYSYNSAGKYITTELGEGGIDDYTKLCLHLNSDFSDSSFYSQTVTSTATISASTYKFGTGSVYFDGTTEITVADSNDWDFYDQPFTVDFWANFSVADNKWRTLIDINTHTSSTIIQYNSDYGFRLWIGGSYVDYPYTVTTGEWMHLEYSRDESGIVRLFINGVQQGSNWTNTSTLSGDTGVFIGRLNGDLQYWIGYIDEVRISKGIARHTTNFDVPSNEYSAYSGVGNMVLESIDIIPDFEPIDARVVIREEDIDTIELNTDLTLSILKGDTWNAGTLTETQRQDSARLLTSEIPLTGTGTTLRYRLNSYNEKRLKIHSVGLLWR